MFRKEEIMLAQLLNQVKELAIDASKIIESIKKPEIKSKGVHDYVTEVDLKISDYLCERLPKLLPDSKVISEEADVVYPDDSFYWIVDPIDGTSNFIYGLPEFAISIGLIKNKKVILGVVYAPALNEIYYAAENVGAYCNKNRIMVTTSKNIESSLVLSETNPYSKTRQKNLFQKILMDLFTDCIDYRITGSAALDCCYIACGRGDVFVSENLKPWDYAAGEIIVKEAGGNLTTFDGKNQIYKGETSVLATNGIVHEKVLRRLKRII